MPDLITLIHRSTAGVVKLINYFKQHWSKKCANVKAHPTLEGKGHISKRQLESKIKAIATKERRNDKARWYVHNNILATYGLAQLGATEVVPETLECNGKSISSPPAVKTGIKQFTRPASPCVTEGASPITVSQMRSAPQQVTNTMSAGQALQFQNGKQCSITPPAKRRMVLQTIPKQIPGSVGAKENQHDQLLPGVEQCFNAVEAKDISKTFLPSENAMVDMKKTDQEKADSSTLQNRLTSAVDKTINIPSTDVVVAVTSNTGCPTVAVKRTAPSPVSTMRAAKVPRNDESVELIPVPNNINMPNSNHVVELLDKINTTVAREPVKHAQCLKEISQASTGLYLVSDKTLPGCSTTNILEHTSVPSNSVHTGIRDGVKPMEIEQIIKA
jgi:hypothetical protein